jgi:hypothetical protein
MISEHEFVLKIRDDLYPRIKQVERDALTMFNQCFPKAEWKAGETGLTGDTEVEWSIQLLQSSARFLDESRKHGFDEFTCNPTFVDLHLRIRRIEAEALELFNRNYAIGRGPTGLLGFSKVGNMIQLLSSAAAMIERLGKDKNVLK